MPQLRRHNVNAKVYPKPATTRRSSDVGWSAQQCIFPGSRRPVTELHTPAVARDRQLITSFIRSHKFPAGQATTREIAEYLQRDATTLTGLLSNMVDDGTLVKPRRGVYALAQDA